MTIASLMVEVDLESDNNALLRFTADLAGQHGASVIGIAVRQPHQILYGDGYVPIQVLEAEESELEKKLERAREHFESAMHGRTESFAWRFSTVLGPSSEYIVQQARAADIVIVGSSRRRAALLGGIVIGAGRPVLVVPNDLEGSNLDRVLIAWKDTREARRVTLDAMPFIRKARAVEVIEVAPHEDRADAASRLEDVILWLRRHGVQAEAQVISASGDNAAQLTDIVTEHHANLVVAGGYGHSRLQEWILGGVTRSLLTVPKCCTFLSH
ncbi:universal stress protein [Acidisoma sp. L85]|uniref:universal stress protein n=1 Tax=Acidisoma sp. L85 TaxID=1641850 RepID=UPI00131C831F|nr:universal stress protein [Acidisoma sp. L85]